MMEFDVVGFVDMTPTPPEYANIARALASSCVADFRPERREEARIVLDSLIEVVAYLAVTDHALVATVQREVRPARLLPDAS